MGSANHSRLYGELTEFNNLTEADKFVSQRRNCPLNGLAALYLRENLEKDNLHPAEPRMLMIDSACPRLADIQVVMYEDLAEIEKRFEDAEVKLCTLTVS